MWPTIIVGAIVAAIFIAVIVKMIKDKKAGKSSCSCGCAGCPMSGSCHNKNNTSRTCKYALPLRH